MVFMYIIIFVLFKNLARGKSILNSILLQIGKLRVKILKWCVVHYLAINHRGRSNLGFYFTLVPKLEYYEIC